VRRSAPTLTTSCSAFRAWVGNARRTTRAFGQGHVLLATIGSPIGKIEQTLSFAEIVKAGS